MALLFLLLQVKVKFIFLIDFTDILSATALALVGSFPRLHFSFSRTFPSWGSLLKSQPVSNASKVRVIFRFFIVLVRRISVPNECVTEVRLRMAQKTQKYSKNMCKMYFRTV